MIRWMDGWIGWCVVVWGESMCFGGRSRRGLPSDHREWWWLLLFRFAGHRVLISSDVCVHGWVARGRTLWVWRTEPQGKA